MRHADAALRLAYLLTGQRELAEDLVHDAFVRLSRRLVHLRDPAAFDAYLRRTIVNLANSHFRRKRLERTFLARESNNPSAAVAEPDVAMREQMRQALLRLSERQRAAVVLRFYEDLSERETAEILGCRPGTVKSLVARAMQALRASVLSLEGDER